MADLNITLGFEFEFHCVYHPDSLTDALASQGIHPFPEEYGRPSPGHAIQSLLKLTGIAVEGWETHFGETEDDDDSAPYSKWRVGVDGTRLTRSEQAMIPPDYLDGSVELASPKFHLSSDWPSQLQKILQLLQMIEHTMGLRLLLNPSTGLHVHVGNDTASLPLTTCKRLLQLATAHERNLDACHSADRIRGPSVPSLPRFAPPSFFLSALDPAAHPTLFSRLHLIEQATSFPELGELFTVEWHGGAAALDGHCAAYNFDNNFPDPSAYRLAADLTRTVEFRQHAGTRDLPAILAWSHVVVCLVLCAHGCPELRFLQLLAAGTDPGFTLPDLLDAMGCHPRVVAHYVRDDRGEGLVGALSALGEVPGLDLAPAGAWAEGELRMLDAVNDEERSRCGEPRAVARAIGRKHAGLAYGLIPAAGPVRVSDEWLWNEMVGFWEEGMDAAPAQIVWEPRSAVRLAVFERLHGIYLVQGALAERSF